MKSTLSDALADRSPDALAMQRALTSFPAVTPANGGRGEYAKALWLETYLRENGVMDIEHVDAPYPGAEGGIRPNMIVRVPGRSEKTLWIFGHIDVVPPGDLSLWKSDPWTVTVDPGDPDLIHGRGVEDNQQAIVSGCLLAMELEKQGITPDLSLGLMLVADEEAGNDYGVDHVLAQRPGIVKKGDLVVVPDFGAPGGGIVEVAEKGVLWLKVTVLGKQCHGSTPDEGVNAAVAASDMIVRIGEIAARFNAEDPLFLPPRSTFSPTKREANVPNVNTIPGKDVFYVDCRVLPRYSFGEVTAAFRSLGDEISAKYGVTVLVETDNIEPMTPPTPADSEVVRRIIKAAKKIYDVDAVPMGVGGSTVASRFRALGIPTAVWANVISNCHAPNEAARLSCAVGDARVFAELLFEE